jgi:hypothetical protein
MIKEVVIHKISPWNFPWTQPLPPFRPIRWPYPLPRESPFQCYSPPTCQPPGGFSSSFAAHIRNPNTRKAYAKAAEGLASWCERRGIAALGQIQPLHIAVSIEELQTSLAPPSVKQHLAAIRMLFDWLVVGR